jgi:spore germination protein YaaH
MMRAQYRRAHRVALTFASAAALSSCASAVVPTESPGPALPDGAFVTGYHAYWAGESWRDYPMDVLDELFFFETEVDGDGRLFDTHGWPGEWRGLLDAASASGVGVTPTVSMHDPEAFEALFPDPERIDRLVTSIMTLLAGTPGLTGLHLDFEVFQPVSAEARDGFTAFVASLSHSMKRDSPGLALSVFTLAFDDDDVYNERALGEIADYLIVQGYDFHSSGSQNAGPLGAVEGWGRLNWGTVVDRFEGFGVPPHKLVMSVPLYGYEWPVESDEMGAATRGQGETVPYAAPENVLIDAPRAEDRAAEFGAQRDPVSGTPWYVFQGEEGWTQGWFDDAESLRAKYDFVRSRGLGGIAIFPLAYGTPGLWADLRNAFRPRQ